MAAGSGRIGSGCLRAGEFEQQFVTVEAAAVAVAEIEANGVVADAFPIEHDHAGKLTLIGAAVALSEDVFFAALFGAGRGGAELFHLEKGFGTVAPGDGDFATDELDVGGCFQGRRPEPTQRSRIGKRTH